MGLTWTACSDSAEPTVAPPGAPEDAATDGTTSTDAAEAPTGRCDHFTATRQPFFGDTHVHTRLSLDAYAQGTRLTAMDAYRFARGEAVKVQPLDDAGVGTRTLQLERPLDFVAVSDHAEFLGLVTLCESPGLEGYDAGDCVQLREDPDQAFIWLNAATAMSQDSAVLPDVCGEDGMLCREPGEAAWQGVIDAAEAANDTSAACGFTSFIAYEWSGGPQAQNLHRNVLFAGSEVPALPTSYFDSGFEEGLWDALRRDCTDTESGCDVLTIPHNSNLSAGLMFEAIDSEGDAFDAAYVEARRQMEPLVEIFQHKGSSECLPGGSLGGVEGLGAVDEQCGFEQLPYETLAAANLEIVTGPVDPTTTVRHAYAEGLRLEDELGTNPFAYGIIASTDTHLAAPGLVADEGYPGHGGAGVSHREELPPGLVDQVAFNPGGLAVVWAEENSRESLFAAMKRREAYGTSGPRMVVRVFGGWGLGDGLCGAADFAEQGYAGGVPMGGDLPAPPEGSDGPPAFAIWAQKDPGTASRAGLDLATVQVVKIWHDADGPHEQVFDVATADGADAAGVDLATCEPTGSGAAELCTVWSDPDFDPAVPALWYVRVLENPSCRWHQYACNAGGVDCADEATVTEGFEPCCEDDFPKTIQDRAWTSPIWYRPPGSGG